MYFCQQEESKGKNRSFYLAVTALFKMQLQTVHTSQLKPIWLEMFVYWFYFITVKTHRMLIIRDSGLAGID